VSQLFISKNLWAALAATVLAVTLQVAWAGPGAHGPNGEHLDAPQTGMAAAQKLNPRIEAKSDLFELVGTLAASELTILIDRYATNEPVLKAQVEIEAAGMKAQAKFQADIGTYSVDDPSMLKKLASPGEHPLVITVIAGTDSDLLDAVLRVEAPPADQAHGIHWEEWGLGAVVGLVLLGIALRRMRSKRRRLFAQGVQA
jgi:hypothetical protein